MVGHRITSNSNYMRWKTGASICLEDHPKDTYLGDLLVLVLLLRVLLLLGLVLVVLLKLDHFRPGCFLRLLVLLVGHRAPQT